MNFKFYWIILLVMLSSCNTSSKHLTGRFYLKHDESGKSISYQIDDDGSYVELIRGAFGRIGFNDNYIIIENSEYEYSIIPVTKEMDNFPEKHILGPFSLNEFNRQKQKLGIKVDFTIDSN